MESLCSDPKLEKAQSYLMFRHAIGTHLHKSGIDILRVSDHLGHSSVSTTSRYVGKEKEKTSILNKYGPLSKKF